MMICPRAMIKKGIIECGGYILDGKLHKCRKAKPHRYTSKCKYENEPRNNCPACVKTNRKGATK